MRHPWFALLLALLNVNFGISVLRQQIRRRERLWEPLLVILAVGVGVASLGWVLIRFLQTVLEIGHGVGQPEVVLTLAHFAAAVIVFVFGLVFVMSSFYFAGDTERLMSWPLRPRQILSAKFATIMVNEYLTLALLLVPVYVLYARYVEVGPGYVPFAVLTFILTPVAPLALASLLVVLLLRVVSIARKRDLFTMVGGFLLVVGALLLQYVMQAQMPELASEADVAEFLFGRAHSLSTLAAAGYPPSFWAMLAVARAGTWQSITALAGYAGLGVLLFGALLALGERFFLTAVQRGRASGRRPAVKRRRWRSLTPVQAIAHLERKLFVRTPVFVLNGFAGFVIIPVLLLVPQLTGGEALQEIAGGMSIAPALGIGAVALWIGAGSALSMIPATAFSREGGRLWILRSQPVSGSTLFLGKLVGTLSMVLPAAVPGAVAFAYFLRLSVPVVVVGLLLGVVLATSSAMLCLWIDTMRPWLTWTDPARAIKSNLNGLIGVIATVVLFGALLLLGFVLAQIGVELGFIVAVLAVLHVAIAAGMWTLIRPRLDHLLARMGG